MIRVRGRYRNQTLELSQPLGLPDGAEVDVEIEAVDSHAALREGWAELGMSRLEAEWDDPDDAIYDDWKALYGV